MPRRAHRALDESPLFATEKGESGAKIRQSAPGGGREFGRLAFELATRLEPIQLENERVEAASVAESERCEFRRETRTVVREAHDEVRPTVEKVAERFEEKGAPVPLTGGIPLFDG